MSTVTSAVTTCPSLQQGLEEIFNDCGASMQVDNMPLLQFLYSPENRTPFGTRLSPAPGKKRTILAVYEQLIADSEVDTISTCDTTCTATTERGDLSQEISMDCDGYQIEGLFDRTSWVDSCKDNYGVIMRTIMRMIGALDMKVSKAIVTEVYDLAGSWDAAVANQATVTGEALIVETLQASTSYTPNPLAWEEISLALNQTGYCAAPFIASGALLYKYNRLLEAGCCSTSGLDLGSLFNLYGRAVAWDRHWEDTYGAEMAITLLPGAVQLGTLNMNGGTETDLPYINVVNGQSNYFETIINSPYTGLPYDLNVKYDCGKVHVVVAGRVKAFGLPFDIFPAGWHRENVTYANLIQVSNS